MLKAKGNKMADCMQCNLLLTLVVDVGYKVYSHDFKIAHLLSGGSVAWGHPQHGKPVHVRDLHRDEEPALPRPSVWGSGHTEGTEVRLRSHRHRSTCTHQNIHITRTALLFQNPVSEAAEQRAGQAEESELLHGVKSRPQEEGLVWVD